MGQIMKNKQLSYAPADLRITYCGCAKPLMNELQDLLKKQIVLLCYDEPKSVSDMTEQLQTGFEYILNAAEALTNAKVLKKENGKYLTLLPIIHLSKNFEATALKNKFVLENEIPKKIVEMTYSLKDELLALDFYGNRFDIKYLNWIFFVMIYNMIQRKLRSFYSDKTDEVVIDNYAWRTSNFDYSASISYKYADENPEKTAPECQKRVEYWSTYYMQIAGINVNNVYDAKPFPDGYDQKKHYKDICGGRNGYINAGNLDFYLNLVKAAQNGTNTKAQLNLNEQTQKLLTDFENKGVVVIKKEGQIEVVIPMIPVISKEVLQKGEAIVYKALTPIIKELSEKIGTKIEELLVPCLGNVKTRKDHFYTFWLQDFINPREELFWYGMNVAGLEIPEDYNKSVAGMWIEV